MVIHNLVGIEDVDYISKKTNKNVIGKKLHLTSTSEKVQGLSVESIFVKNELISNLSIGDNLQVFYNKYGQVETILPY